MDSLISNFSKNCLKFFNHNSKRLPRENIKTIVAAFIAVSLIIGACSSSTTNPPAATKYMTAKVDGAAWDGTTLSSAVINSGTLVISGSVGIKSIVIFLIGGTAAGTYDLSNFASGASASYSGGTTAADAYSANPASGSGTVVISKINTTEVEGTFSFIGQNSSGGAKTVTEGKFSLKF